MPAPGRQVSAAGVAVRRRGMGREAPAAVVARVGVERAVPALRRRNSLADFTSLHPPARRAQNKRAVDGCVWG